MRTAGSGYGSGCGPRGPDSGGDSLLYAVHAYMCLSQHGAGVADAELKRAMFHLALQASLSSWGIVIPPSLGNRTNVRVHVTAIQSKRVSRCCSESNKPSHCQCDQGTQVVTRVHHHDPKNRGKKTKRMVSSLHLVQNDMAASMYPAEITCCGQTGAGNLWQP